MKRTLVSVLAACCLMACSNDGGAGMHLSREDLLKPETCKECHRQHYEQWSGSMHAYASKDPVFRAMNARGQREAKLGNFCVNCHAPMAVIEGETTDGTNLDQVPEHLQGVTCYFCHNVTSVESDHNNMLKLAGDTTMRAAVPHPVDPKAHEAAYSELHDGNQLKSSTLCGGCHDIVTPNHGVHLERTFAEYKASFFSDPGVARAESCQGCHMDGRPGSVIADVEGVPGNRTFHDHLWPAVDVALSSFPHSDALKAAVADCALPQSIQYFDFQPDLNAQGRFILTLETAAGHNQPSGASQDRRMWLEIAAYDQDGNLTYESGKIADDAVEKNPNGEPLTIFHDSIFDATGKEVHMFWDADKSTDYPEGYQSRALPIGKSIAVGSHSVSIPLNLGVVVPGRIEIRIRMRPMGFDVLQDLVDSGDLDAGVMAEIPTFTVYSTVLEWQKGGSPFDFAQPVQTNIPDCKSYKCMIDPTLAICQKD